MPCPGCGHNLRGTTECRCPQCRESLRLGIVWDGDPRRELRFLLAGVIGLSAGLGGFVLVAGPTYTLVGILGMGSLELLLPVWLPAITILTGLLIAWVGWRRRIASMSRKLRLALLGACYAVIAVAYGALLVVFLYVHNL